MCEAWGEAGLKEAREVVSPPLQSVPKSQMTFPLLGVFLELGMTKQGWGEDFPPSDVSVFKSQRLHCFLAKTDGLCGCWSNHPPSPILESLQPP